MAKKIEGILKFKEIMQMHESLGVPQEALLASCRASLVLLVKASHPDKVSLFKLASNYAEELYSLSDNNLESRNTLRAKVKSIAGQMLLQLKTHNKDNPLPKKFKRLNMVLELMLKSFDYSTKRTVLIELLKAEPDKQFKIFEVAKDYSQIAREAYSYLN